VLGKGRQSTPIMMASQRVVEHGQNDNNDTGKFYSDAAKYWEVSFRL